MTVLSQEEIHLPKRFLEGERIEDVIGGSCVSTVSLQQLHLYPNCWFLEGIDFYHNRLCLH